MEKKMTYKNAYEQIVELREKYEKLHDAAKAFYEEMVEEYQITAWEGILPNAAKLRDLIAAGEGKP